MRIFSVLASTVVIALAFGIEPGRSLDGSPSPDTAAVTPQTPGEAFRSATEALRTGEKTRAVTSLQYAAEHGHAIALWQLGRIYADGDGVPRDDRRAFEYFQKFADSHADDNPATPRARFVANAFVALGHYYLEGIPNSTIKANPGRAREMFSYAASYFGDADAQYNLARMYLEGNGTSKDPRQAARWLDLAAKKGQYHAQAVLGHMLFKGGEVPRQAARGLMWLTLARDSAASGDTWIHELYDSAFKQATDDERQVALIFLERWMKGRRE
jgi:TPR repeat protein